MSFSPGNRVVQTFGLGSPLAGGHDPLPGVRDPLHPGLVLRYRLQPLEQGVPH